MASVLADVSLSRMLVLNDKQCRRARQVHQNVGVEGPRWGNSILIIFYYTASTN
jgi:hypothetical protein